MATNASKTRERRKQHARSRRRKDKRKSKQAAQDLVTRAFTGSTVIPLGVALDMQAKKQGE